MPTVLWELSYRYNGIWPILIFGWRNYLCQVNRSEWRLGKISTKPSIGHSMVVSPLLRLIG
eukprot:scaffold90347_cov136-Cyclotella_meneghiniana.AAC.1